MITLLLALAAPRALAADTYIYYNPSYMALSDVTPLKNALVGVGASVTTSTSSSWPTSWTGYKLVIILLPASHFSTTQVSALATMVNGGGRLVVSSDYGNSSEWGSANSYVQSLNSDLGTGMSLRYQVVDGSGCASTTSISSDQVTTSVSTMQVAASNTISGGTTLVRYGADTVMAVSQPSSASSARTPNDVILSGDVNMFLDDCSGYSTFGHNVTLWENLYLGLCGDADGDGHDDDTCGGDDCDDSNRAVYPGAAEVVADSIDQDCDTVDSCYNDSDGDNYGTSTVIDGSSLNCTTGRGAPVSTDCDDADSSVYPGATEIPYDGIDNDCYGGDLTDVDGDGYDSDTVSGGTDCDDSDATVHPRATQGADGVDDDCDGTVDELTDWYDDDGDGWTESGGDCDDTNSGIHSGATETCNGIDDDCDGEVDEDTNCSDDDGDGWSEYEGDCSDGDASVNPGERETDGNGIDDDCDGTVDDGSFDEDGDGYTTWAGDCDDTDAAVHPGAAEAPDGKDNDCDGIVDEGTNTYDDDGDGYSEAGGDCDDTDATVSPSTDEVNANGVDDDCDGELDEGGLGTDDDGDGYSEDQGDCDDTNPEVSPAADEVDANTVDDDCDDAVDEGFEDLDADGYSVTDGDCDDSNGWVWPGATEMCDAVDNNCDGVIDEGCDVVETDTGSEAKKEGCGCATGDAGLGWAGLLVVAAGLVRRRG